MPFWLLLSVVTFQVSPLSWLRLFKTEFCCLGMKVLGHSCKERNGFELGRDVREAAGESDGDSKDAVGEGEKAKHYHFHRNIKYCE